MQGTKPLAQKDELARFLSDASRESLREFLKNHAGEQDRADFKKSWPEFASLAKHILGIANSGGGCVIFGVEQADDNTFDPVGLDQLTDKADFSNRVQSYLPECLHRELNLLDFSYESSEYLKISGRKFQVLFVPHDPLQLPYISMREGKGIRPNTIYLRRHTQTVEANHEGLQQLINMRLATGYSSKPEITLRNHLEELRLLHLELTKWRSQPIAQQMSAYMAARDCERYDVFLSRTIDQKTLRIQSLLLNGVH